VPRVRRSDCGAQMLSYTLLQSSFPLTLSVVDRFLPKWLMPEVVSNVFKLQHLESVLRIPKIPRMHPFPIDELSSALPTTSRFILGDHRFSSLETVEPAPAVSVGALDV
jgi:hypothetical protein